jgi:sugar phosphate isomerase/epimerase
VSSAEALLATCWTTAGDAAPLRGDGRSPLPLRTRVEAAARAGFRGFGVAHVDLMAGIAELGLPGVRSVLDDNGIVHREVELLTHWWSDGPARAASDAVRRDLFAAAESLGAQTVKIAPDVGGGPWDADRWAGELAGLGREAAEHGTRVALEFLPWSNIADVHQGLRLVEAAGHPAAGLLVDAWHVGRAGTPIADLAGLPVERIFGVELDDFDDTVVGTLFEDTRDRRRYCGEGGFDLPAMIGALRHAGWRGPWGVEILSDRHRAAAVDEGVTRAFTTAQRLLHRVATTPGTAPGPAPHPAERDARGHGDVDR